MTQVGPTIIRLVPSSPVLVGGFAWAGAVLFAASLGYFLFTYTFTFGRVTVRRGRGRGPLWNLTLFTVFALHHSSSPARRVRDGHRTNGASGTRAFRLRVDRQPAVHPGLPLVASGARRGLAGGRIGRMAVLRDRNLPASG